MNACDLPQTARLLTARPATDDDRDFLRGLYAETRQAEMALVPWTPAQKDGFLAQQFHAQHIFYHAQFPDAAYDVLLHGGTPVGRLYVDRRPDEVAILDITLRPEYRGAGIGGALIHEILDEAAASARPVRLHVEPNNPARRLYERLGFEFVREDGFYLLMEWTPTE